MREGRASLVWETALRFLRERDVEGYASAETFVPDGVVELPYPLPGMPRRTGARGPVRRVLAPVWRPRKDGPGRILESVEPIVVHEGPDPELLVIEFETHGIDASGTPYRLSYVHVVTVPDGRIAVPGQNAGEAKAARDRTPSAEDERSKSLVRRYLATWSTGEFDHAAPVFADGFVDHAQPDLRGPAAAAAAARRFRSTNGDAAITVDTLAAEGELVAARTTARRARGGESIVTSGMAFFRVRQRLLVEQWSCYPSPSGGRVGLSKSAGCARA